MIYLFYTSIIGIFILMFILFKNNRINYIATFLLTLITIYFILNPNLIIESSKNGAKLFFNNLFPTLFPFLVITELLILYGGVSIYSKTLGPLICKPLKLPSQCSLTLVINFLCGYPLGAKYSCHLYEEKLINKDTFKRLLNIASSTNPLFIIGAVSSSMLKLPRVGFYLLIANYLSCFIMAYIGPLNKEPSLEKTTKFTNPNFGSIFKEALDNSLKTALSVGTYVVIFSILVAIIKNSNGFYNIVNYLSKILFFLPKDAISGVVLGIFEITNGSYILAESSLPINLKLSFISFLCSFSGLSIICQVHSFIYKIKDVSITRYILKKFIQGVVSFFITYVIFTFIPLDISTFNSNFNQSIYISFIPLIILFIIPMFILKIRKLFNVS
ncbi:sporulation integral membrane protein YlbJ [Clostridium sp.]|uniref:sporulation integral membrane protein YlbJ n=1 Tax=Clostridium sp. TaxID=1506 RepID=UPI003463F938